MTYYICRRGSIILISSVNYDRRVVANTITGDNEAFGYLVRRYQKKAYNIARTVLKVHEDAEDAVQDAFAQAFEKLHMFNSDFPFEPWISTIVSNKAHDIARKEKVRDAESIEENLLNDDHSFVHDSFWDHAELFDLSDRLARALKALPERQRIVTLMYYQGFSHSEICKTIGIPNGTSRSDLSHARNRLRQVLEVENQP